LLYADTEPPLLYLRVFKRLPRFPPTEEYELIGAVIEEYVLEGVDLPKLEIQSLTFCPYEEALLVILEITDWPPRRVLFFLFCVIYIII
jgi:hypothetical protein